jgi:2-methylisocitrate lyase-like PEP mutase family enzyme
MSSIKIDNSYALTLKALHQPSNPLILANIYDPGSTTTLLSLNATHPGPVKALATTSFAIAATLSTPDPDLTLTQNLSSISQFSPLIRAANLPLTIDLQDGYGDQLIEAMQGAIAAGAVGANIEDSYPEKGFGDGMACLKSVEEASERIRTAMRVAKEMGVPDFVVNARADVLCLRPNPEGWSREMMVQETVRRGKAYLDAGATCVFAWGPFDGNVTRDEIRTLVGQFQGRLAVKLGNRREDPSVRELADMGVCRISVGGGLLNKDEEGIRRFATRIFNGGQFWSEED